MKMYSMNCVIQPTSNCHNMVEIIESLALSLTCLFFVCQVDMEKVNLDIIKPWITKKLIDILGAEDDVVMQYVFNMLESEKVK